MSSPKSSRDYMCTTSNAFFFFNDTATTEIYTLSLHDALPISRILVVQRGRGILVACPFAIGTCRRRGSLFRSEEHTSELQSRSDLVCRLLLEKKKDLTDIRSIRLLD